MIIVNKSLVVAFLESSSVPKKVGGVSYVLACREFIERRGIAHTRIFSHQSIKWFIMGEAIASEEMTYPGINIMDGKASSKLARGRRGRNGVKPTINASQYWGSKAE